MSRSISRKRRCAFLQTHLRWPSRLRGGSKGRTDHRSWSMDLSKCTSWRPRNRSSERRRLQTG
eukprot:scaffold2893_cov254-Pinguiococcus_pyrenoidosus.AAC.7